MSTKTMAERMHDVNKAGLPWIVAELDRRLVGYAYATTWKPRHGYRFSVEASVYIRLDAHRRGIGRAILGDLIERARKLGYHALIGGASAEQTASVALQESLGFQRVGSFKEIGYKFDQWLDVVFMQLML